MDPKKAISKLNAHFDKIYSKVDDGFRLITFVVDFTGDNEFGIGKVVIRQKIKKEDYLCFYLCLEELFKTDTLLELAGLAQLYGQGNKKIKQKLEISEDDVVGCEFLGCVSFNELLERTFIFETIEPVKGKEFDFNVSYYL